MLQVIAGIPGSNKTLYATSLAVKYMKKGRPVFTNYPVCYRTIFGREYKTYKLTKKMLRDQVFPPGSILIIDEAQMWFNSRKFEQFSDEDLLLFSQHRHFGYEMFLITQHPARLDKVIREICNIFWILDKFPICTLATGYYEYGHIDSLSSKVRCKRKLIFGLSRYYTAYDTCYGAVKVPERLFVSWHSFQMEDLRFKRIKDMLKNISSIFKIRKNVPKVDVNEEV